MTDSTDIKVTIQMGHAATSGPEGMVNMLGMGFVLLPARPVPFGVGLFFEIPWDDLDYNWLAELLDEDGDIVFADGEPVSLSGAIAPGDRQRPPFWPAGCALTGNTAFHVGGLPLDPGKYTWQVAVNGNTEQEWTLDFYVVEGLPG